MPRSTTGNKRELIDPEATNAIRVVCAEGEEYFQLGSLSKPDLLIVYDHLYLDHI